MKQVRKMLALNLALVMLLTALVPSVMAAAAEVIKLGKTVKGIGGYDVYSFTPEEDGLYLIDFDPVEIGGTCPRLALYESDKDITKWFDSNYDLSAGKTYKFVVSGGGVWNVGTNSFTLTIKKRDLAAEAAAKAAEEVAANATRMRFEVISEVSKTAKLSGWTSNRPSGALVVPSQVEIGGRSYTLVSIEEKALKDCSELTDVTIPSGVTSIGKEAFDGCRSLTSVTIPSSVTSIGEEAFDDCSSLTSVTIPEGVTSIGREVFSYCSSLTSVTIPSSVTSIGYEAFDHCSSLTGVTIPSSVTSIGDGAFSGCDSLTSITVANGNPNYASADGCLIDKSKSTLVLCPKKKVGDVTLPSGVATVRAYAFSGCESLTNVNIPNSVTAIEGSAFSGCTGLTNVNIPTGVTTIGDSAFSGCTGLTSVNISNSVTKLGSRAFSDCTGLTNINIPGSVAKLDSGAFSDCTGLTDVTISAGVTAITSSAFSGCTSLTNVNIPTSVTTIGDSAFSGCTGLTNVNIPNSVTFIGDSAFSGCTGLTNVNIPNSVTGIGGNAFYGCNDLSNITIPSSVTKIGTKAFEIYGVTLSGYSGSYAETYAGKNSIPFVPLGTPIPSTGIAYTSTQTVDVDGKAVLFECYALKDAKGNPTNYIKLRDIASVLNHTSAQFQVGWDNKKGVTITTGQEYTPNGSEMSTPFSGDRSYEVPAAQTWVNGKVANLEAIVLTNDRGGQYTYYKLRDLGAALGFKVEWSSKQGICIKTK